MCNKDSLNPRWREKISSSIKTNYQGQMYKCNQAKSDTSWIRWWVIIYPNITGEENIQKLLKREGWFLQGLVARGGTICLGWRVTSDDDMLFYVLSSDRCRLYCWASGPVLAQSTNKRLTLRIINRMASRGQYKYILSQFTHLHVVQNPFSFYHRTQKEIFWAFTYFKKI